jgi:hypothetical protein
MGLSGLDYGGSNDSIQLCGEVTGFVEEFLKVRLPAGDLTLARPMDLKHSKKDIHPLLAPIQFKDAIDGSDNRFVFVNGRMEYWSDGNREMFQVSSVEVVSDNRFVFVNGRMEGAATFYKVIVTGDETDQDVDGDCQWDMELPQSYEGEETVATIQQMFAATRAAHEEL